MFSGNLDHWMRRRTSYRGTEDREHPPVKSNERRRYATGDTTLGLLLAKLESDREKKREKILLFFHLFLGIFTEHLLYVQMT